MAIFATVLGVALSMVDEALDGQPSPTPMLGGGVKSGKMQSEPTQDWATGAILHRHRLSARYLAGTVVGPIHGGWRLRRGPMRFSPVTGR